LGSKDEQMTEILMLNHNPAEIGTYFRVANLAKQLASVGHSVTVFTTNPEPCWKIIQRPGVFCELRFSSFAVFRWSIGGGYQFLDTAGRLLKVLQQRWELVHSFGHQPNVLFPAILHKYLKGADMYVDWADWWGKGNESPLAFSPWTVAVENWFEELAPTLADGVTTISSVLYQRALSLGLQSSRLLHLVSGADTDFFRPIDKQQCRRKLALPQGAFIVGFIGRVDMDLDILLEAIHEVRKGVRRTRLLVVGTGLLEKNLANELDDEMTLCVGPQPFRTLPSYLGACDVLALPMRDNTVNRARWPNKLGEYLAAGRPVVASKVGDVANFLSGHRCGLLASSAEEFAQHLLALESDANLRADLSRRARRAAVKFLSWPELAAKLENFYGLENWVEHGG
jgi:glycosyltransferase involved in cell wall biosynthesis